MKDIFFSLSSFPGDSNTLENVKYVLLFNYSLIIQLNIE